jgi:HEAT repeat protein
MITSKLLAFNDNHAEKINILRQVLLYFSPEIITALGPVVSQTKSLQVQKMILGVIEYLSLKDIGPLEKVLEKSDKVLGEKLLPLLKGMKGNRSNPIFLKMVKHPSEKLRRESVLALLSRDKAFALQLFPLINDPSPLVRKNVLAGLAKHKSSQVEGLIIKHIKQNTDVKDEELILDCYRTLGNCGSVISVSFLKRILLSKSWNRFTGFGKLVHREGAATALALMNSWEAQDVLMKASSSRSSIIREAYNRAMSVLDSEGGNNNG